MVDLPNRQIRMIDGSSPIILINGISRGKVFQMIDPKNIEAVEVVDNPSAKYRGGEGNITVLNLRVKRNTDLSQYADFFSKQMLSLKFGVYSASYGLEKDKFSLFLSLSTKIV